MQAEASSLLQGRVCHCLPVLMTNPAPDSFFPGLSWGPRNLLSVGNQLERAQTWNLPEMASSRSLPVKEQIFPSKQKRKHRHLGESVEPGMLA